MIPWKGNGDPTHADRLRQERWRAIHEGNWKTAPEPLSSEICYQSVAPFIVDMHGDSYLCCSQPFSPATRIGNFLEDSFELQLFRRVNHPCCRGCTMKNPVAMPAHYVEWLAKGALAHYGLPPETLGEVGEEAQLADRLAGREVYFWGSVNMLRRKMRVFSRCRPVCILTDDADAPAHVANIPVRRPDAELKAGRALPVVIFAGEEARDTIREKLRSAAPWITEICHCSAR